MTLPQDVIGLDSAKGRIDTFTLSTRKHERIATTKQALARFARAAKNALAVCEASGGQERPLTEALARAGVDCARAPPPGARVRRPPPGARVRRPPPAAPARPPRHGATGQDRPG